MTKTELFQQTIDAWLTKDVNKFLSALTENISYTECYGAQYEGKIECEKWFRQWTAPLDNRVKSWIITDSHFDGDFGIFTWTFDCHYAGQDSLFDGISLVKFTENKICQIQEFEQKHDKFRPFLNGKENEND